MLNTKFFFLLPLLQYIANSSRCTIAMLHKIYSFFYILSRISSVSPSYSLTLSFSLSLALHSLDFFLLYLLDLSLFDYWLLIFFVDQRSRWFWVGVMGCNLGGNGLWVVVALVVDDSGWVAILVLVGLIWVFVVLIWVWVVDGGGIFF